MAHASSALEAAEAALKGLFGPNGGNGEGGNAEGEYDLRGADDIQNVFNKAIEVQLEPYEKFERNQVEFFDKSSSAEKGRFRVRDAREFAPETMRRKEDADRGVMLLVGRKVGQQDVEHEECITILFDKAQFSESNAIEWWQKNRHRFVGEGKFAAGGDKPTDMY
jgi:hypothetical protein